MTTFGMSPTGFTPKQLPDVISTLQANAQTVFGDLVQPGDTVDTSSDSLLGRLIALVSPSIADLWSVAQSVNDSFNPYAATGIAEDNLFTIAGVTRKPAIASTVDVLLGGTPGTLIPAGSLVHATVTSQDYATPADITLSPALAEQVSVYLLGAPVTGHVYTISFYPNPTSSGVPVTLANITYTALSTDTAFNVVTGLAANCNSLYSSQFRATVGTAQQGGNSINTLSIESSNYSTTYTFTADSTMAFLSCQTPITVQCVATGPYSDPIGSLTQIKTPVYGWSSVNNVFAGVVGQALEDDVTYRNRFLSSASGSSSNMIDSLTAALLAIPNVSSAKVYENTADTPSVSPAMPPHSMYAIVTGGASSAIAQAIWDNHPAGIATVGSLTGTAYDLAGNPHTMYYDTPVAVPIYISLNITLLPGFPTTGNADIEAALVAWGTANLTVGTVVQYSRLFTPINSVPGFYVNSLTIGTTASPTGTVNIPIAYNQMGVISAANITIIS